jgi:hypothetical protein
MKPVIRCSSLDRLLGCPGSRTLLDKIAAETADIGEADGDEMTWRGNWAHWKAASLLVSDFGAIGAPDKPVLPTTFTPDARDIAMVGWYISQVVVTTPVDHQLYVETRVTMEFPRFILTGQLDTHSISPDETEFTINDLKTGMFTVDHAENNWQLTGYTVLLKKLHAKAQRGKISIHQKYANEQTTTAEVDNLDGLAAYLEAKINDALDRYLELETGHKQCRLCQAAYLPCPAIKKEIDSMKILLTEEEVTRLEVIPNLKELAEVCARGRAVAGPIKKLLERLKARVATEGSVVLADGTTVSISEANGASFILHTKAAFLLVQDKIGEDAAWEALEISLGKIEEQLIATGAVKFKSSKVEPANSATGWVKQNLRHLIQQPRVKQLKFS